MNDRLSEKKFEEILLTIYNDCDKTQIIRVLQLVAETLEDPFQYNPPGNDQQKVINDIRKTSLDLAANFNESFFK